MPVRSSLRAKVCLAILGAGYLAIAVVAGAPQSPLTVLLPAGISSPSWAATLAKAFDLHRVGRSSLIGVSWLLVVVVLVAFALLLWEAWSRRVGIAAVLIGSGVSLTISVAAPVLLSHDVLTYAAYGRIDAVYHHNPYVTKLSAFPHDPFVAVTPGQWLHTHSVYGPVFTLASTGIARMFAGSPTATIFAFKLLAGLAIAAATGLVALTATRTRPDRAPLAAAIVGLNPVLVVHTVGGGHVDALIAAPLAAATAIAVTRPQVASARSFAITVLLTLAWLIKAVIVPALALWLLWIVRRERKHPGRILTAHLALVAGLSIASVLPYLAGWHTLAPFATLGGVEAWASPSHLVGHAVRGIVGSSVGPDAAEAVQAAFLLLFAVLLWRLAGRASSLADAWGVALLLLALSIPFFLPWYAAWFAPFVGLLADEALLLAGVLVTGVLALTLVPADPFHGLTAPAVMDGAHYGAASVLLLVLLFVTFRVLPGGHRLGAATGSARARVSLRGLSFLRRLHA